MQGWKRRVAYVGLFEAFGMAATALVLGTLSGSGAQHSTIMAVMVSTTAVTVTFFYNLAFEKWESLQVRKERTTSRRILHAVAYEVALIAFLLPVIAWWLNVSLVQAFVYDAVLMVFFPIYTFIFTLCFDKVFGLPDPTGKVRPA